jgi:hypothetical protein
LTIYLLGPTEYILCFCKMNERSQLHKGCVSIGQIENTEIQFQCLFNVVLLIFNTIRHWGFRILEIWRRVVRRVFADVSKALRFFETSADTGPTTHYHIPKTETLRSLPVTTSNLIYSFFFKYSLSWNPAYAATPSTQHILMF